MYFDSLPSTTEDWQLSFPGYHGYPAICRIRVYRPAGKTPVIIATELANNPGTQISNRTEVIFRLAWSALGHPDPVIFIEHYPESQKRFIYDEADAETFDAITFPRTRSGNLALRAILPDGEIRDLDVPSTKLAQASRVIDDLVFGQPTWKRVAYWQIERSIRRRLLPNPNREITEPTTGEHCALTFHTEQPNTTPPSRPESIPSFPAKGIIHRRVLVQT